MIMVLAKCIMCTKHCPFKVYVVCLESIVVYPDVWWFVLVVIALPSVL